MTKAPTFRQIEDQVRRALVREFDDIKIIEVKANTAYDSDGDEILKIDVIFQAKEEALDARQLSGAVRRLRPDLFSIGEHRFPLMSFISQSDTGLGKFASA